VARTRDFGRFTRSLRFRLTASYALFFAVLLTGVAALFRERLAYTLDQQVQDVLDQEWAAIKAYLKIERNEAKWYYDFEDPDETFIVERLRRVYLLADARGNPLEVSTQYQALGVEPPAEIQRMVKESQAPVSPGGAANTLWRTRYTPSGAKFLIRSGVIYDEGHKAPYFLAIGRPLSENDKILSEFTWIYGGVIPAALLIGSVLGWVMAGRALTPVLSVAQAARRISGSNLSLRIPARGAGDELDYLILTFNRMIDRLENSFRQIRQFSTDVSHELRTPITAIRGQLEVALFTADSAEQYREAILNALQDIERLSQIVRALLLLSQAESGQLELQKTTLNLSEVARDAVDQFQIPAEAARVRLTAELPAVVPARADRVQIERMLTNLLSNALKFTPPEGHIRVSLKGVADQVEMVVEDTGRGIPREHLPHIFDRFYRVPEGGGGPGPEQGLGLGLSFVAWIVKAHSGQIEVDSIPGKGTRFMIRLPADMGPRPAGEDSGQPVAPGMKEA
jgi:heavy metal sensor kinase